MKNYPGIIVRQRHTDQKQNAIAERAVRRVKEGTCALLLQSGLDDGKSPYGRRFGMPFNGPITPFGAMVEYHPISAKDISRQHQFSPKVLPGLFLGYVLYAGGIWKGDIMIADVEELEEIDASELYARRLNAKEVLTPMRGDNFIFSVADGTVKISGGDQRLRTSTLIRPRPIQGESTLIFLENQKGLFHNLMTHFRLPVKR